MLNEDIKLDPHYWIREVQKSKLRVDDPRFDHIHARIYIPTRILLLLDNLPLPWPYLA